MYSWAFEKRPPFINLIKIISPQSAHFFFFFFAWLLQSRKKINKKVWSSQAKYYVLVWRSNLITLSIHIFLQHGSPSHSYIYNMKNISFIYCAVIGDTLRYKIKNKYMCLHFGSVPVVFSRYYSFLHQKNDRHAMYN